MGTHRTSETSFSATSISDVTSLASESSGVDLSHFDEAFMIKSADARIAANSLATTADYLDLLRTDDGEMAKMLESLRVGYSEFFRDSLSWALLEQRVLPSVSCHKRDNGASEIRVWSAACADGQEAYSLAIMLAELSQSQDRPVPFRVIASDVSESALATARASVYDREALGNVRMRHLDRWFTPAGAHYTVVPELRECVDFSTYDLLDEHSSCPPASIFGGFNIVMCCNLLFYYRPDVRRSILKKLHGCLAAGGYLVTGEAERDIVIRSGGFRGLAPSASIFRKLETRR